MKRILCLTVILAFVLLACSAISAQQPTNFELILSNLRSTDLSLNKKASDELKQVQVMDAIQNIDLFTKAISSEVDMRARARLRDALQVLSAGISNDGKHLIEVSELLRESVDRRDYDTAHVAQTILTTSGSASISPLLSILDAGWYSNQEPRNFAAAALSDLRNLDNDQATSIGKAFKDNYGLGDVTKFWLAVCLANNRQASKEIYAALSNGLKYQETRMRLDAALAIEKLVPFGYGTADEISDALGYTETNFQFAETAYADTEVALEKKYRGRDFNLTKKDEDDENNAVNGLSNLGLLRASLIRRLAIVSQDKVGISDKVFKMLTEKPHILNKEGKISHLSGLYFGCDGFYVRSAEACGQASILSAFKTIGAESADELNRQYELLLQKDYKPDSREMDLHTDLIIAISNAGYSAGTSIPLLIRDLDNESGSVGYRLLLIEALGSVGGAKPDVVIPRLMQLYRSRKLGLDVEAANSVGRIGLQLAQKNNTAAIRLLQDAWQELSTSDRPTTIETAAQLDQYIQKLDDVWWTTNVYTPITDNAKYLLPVMVIGVFLIISSFLYWLNPRTLFTINQKLLEPPFDYKIPVIGGVSAPIRYFLTVGFFHYSHRVTNAWLSEHIHNVERLFKDKTTVKERDTFVPLPVQIGETDPSKPLILSAEVLRPIFESVSTWLTILGDGGVGKTSLACSIAKWGIGLDEVNRLSSNFMLPILIEQGVDRIGDGKENEVEQIVKYQIKQYTNARKSPSSELVRKLAESKHLLIVVDGFSELSESARDKIIKDLKNLSANAVVLTSREGDESLQIFSPVNVRPQHVRGILLADFLKNYLEARTKKVVPRNHKAKTYRLPDEDLYEMCHQLVRITADTETTVLFVKLFADLRVAAKFRLADDNLPHNVPELVLYYVNYLNRDFDKKKGVEKVSNSSVRSSAKIVAWQCLKSSIGPGQAESMVNRGPRNIGYFTSKAKGVEIALNKKNPEPHETCSIEHLEQIKLIRRIGIEDDDIRFAYDPLAEYLASMYLLEEFQDAVEQWGKFINYLRADDEGVEKKMGFVFALHDCCTTKYRGLIPEFAVEALVELIASRSEINSEESNETIADWANEIQYNVTIL